MVCSGDKQLGSIGLLTARHTGAGNSKEHTPQMRADGLVNLDVSPFYMIKVQEHARLPAK